MDQKLIQLQERWIIRWSRCNRWIRDWSNCRKDGSTYDPIIILRYMDLVQIHCKIWWINRWPNNNIRWSGPYSIQGWIFFHLNPKIFAEITFGSTLCGAEGHNCGSLAPHMWIFDVGVYANLKNNFTWMKNIRLDSIGYGGESWCNVIGGSYGAPYNIYTHITQR